MHPHAAQSPPFFQSILRLVYLVGVTLAVATALLWVATGLFDARPQAARLIPAGASPESRIRYQATLSGKLDAPLAVAIGPGGDVYVADTGNGLVRVYSPEGVEQRTIGRKATGETAEPGTFKYPVGLAAGPDRLYVSDNVTGHISTFTFAGEFSGYFGAEGYGFTTESTENTENKESEGATEPQDAATAQDTGDSQDAEEAQAPGDTEAAIQAEDGGETQSSVLSPQSSARPGQLPHGRGSDGASSAPSTQHSALVQVPGSLYWSRDLLYVSDIGAHKIVALRRDGTVEKTFGTGRGAGPGQLEYPGSVWVDDTGMVFVADGNNHRVQIFGKDGEPHGSITGPDLVLPRGIIGDGAGRLYVTNTLGHTIGVLTIGGEYLYSYGSSGSDWTELGFPSGVALNGDRLYVADRANNRVQVYLLPLRE